MFHLESLKIYNFSDFRKKSKALVIIQWKNFGNRMIFERVACFWKNTVDSGTQWKSKNPFKIEDFLPWNRFYFLSHFWPQKITKMHRWLHCFFTSPLNSKVRKSPKSLALKIFYEYVISKKMCKLTFKSVIFSWECIAQRTQGRKKLFLMDVKIFS